MLAQPLDPSHEPLVQFAAAGRQVAGRRESPAEDRHAEEDGFDERRLPRKEGDQQGVEVRAMVADDDRAADVRESTGRPAGAGRASRRAPWRRSRGGTSGSAAGRRRAACP